MELELRALPLARSLVQLVCRALVSVPVGPAVFSRLWRCRMVPLFLSMEIMTGLEATNLIRLLKNGPLLRLVQKLCVRLMARRSTPALITPNFVVLKCVKTPLTMPPVIVPGPTTEKACLTVTPILANRLAAARISA